MDVQETILANAVAGLVVAIGVAALGVFVSQRITDRWDRKKAQQKREHAAAAEFYRAYGDFFAAWKAWDAYSRDREEVNAWSISAPERLSLLTWAAQAEGAMESFLMRLAIEHRLDDDDLKCLWCFRTAYKQLRYNIRNGRPLAWWRTDAANPSAEPERHQGFIAYEAFKGLALHVAAILVSSQGRDDRPEPALALTNLTYVTGPSVDNAKDWVAIYDQLKLNLTKRLLLGAP